VKFRYILLAIGCLFLVTDIFPQTGKSIQHHPFAKRWYMGITLGPDFYYGDLTSGSVFPKGNVSMAGSLFFHHHFNDLIGLRIQLLAGGLNGSVDLVTEGKTVTAAFTGLFIETEASATLNFSNLIVPPTAKRRVFVYGHLGLGVGGWYSKLLNKVYNYDSLSTDNPLNNFNASLILPFGIGGIFRISDKFHASVEWTWRTCFSDKVDNTSGGYKFDVVDYLAFGIAMRIGGKGKVSKDKPEILDYTYPVYPKTYQPPVQTPVQPVQPLQPVQSRQVVPDEEFDYMVQIFAFDKHNYSAEWIEKRYKINYKVTREREGTLSRYIIGNTRDLNAARALRDEMLQKGISDAFIVAYRNGVRHHTVTTD